MADVSDRLAAIKARWFTDAMHRPEYWADLASRDIPALVEEVSQLRELADERGREITRLWEDLHAAWDDLEAAGLHPRMTNKAPPP